MNVNHEIIHETVVKLLQDDNAKSICTYINNAISNHKQVLPTLKPAIEHQAQFIFVFYAEQDEDTKIELTGFELKNGSLCKEKKIRIRTEKDSRVIQDLLIMLYTNIASNIQL